MADTGLESIDQLIKLLAGTKSTSTTTADNSGLEEILKQALGGSGDQEALLATLFQQAGAKIPGIMGNTYNASGSRQAPGKIAPQLAQLQIQLATAAQAQIAQQKQQQLQTAVQAASQIGQNTKQQVVQQANGGLSTTQKIAKLLGGNDAIKKLTSIDLIGEGRDLVKKKTAGLFDDSTASNLAAGGLDPMNLLVNGNSPTFDTGAAAMSSGLNSGLFAGSGGNFDLGGGGNYSDLGSFFSNDLGSFGSAGGLSAPSASNFNYDTSINDNATPYYNYGGGSSGGLSLGNLYNGSGSDPYSFANFNASNGGLSAGFNFSF